MSEREDAVQPLPGVGVVGMRERAAALGGSLEVCARPGGGTSVTATIPSPAQGEP